MECLALSPRSVCCWPPNGVRLGGLRAAHAGGRRAHTSKLPEEDNKFETRHRGGSTEAERAPPFRSPPTCGQLGRCASFARWCSASIPPGSPGRSAWAGERRRTPFRRLGPAFDGTSPSRSASGLAAAASAPAWLTLPPGARSCPVPAATVDVRAPRQPAQVVLNGVTAAGAGRPTPCSQ